MSRSVPAVRPGSGPPSPPGYPVVFEVDRQESYSRLLIFVKWILAIPHYIVLTLLWIGALFAVVIAWFAVLFTGKYPSGIFNFVVGTLRWSQRVTDYALLMTDAYPPFSFDYDPNYSVRVAIEYPGKMANWRPLVQWILIIPYYIAAQMLAAIWLYLIVIISWFAILFTGRYPQALWDFSLVAQRWNLRAGAYGLFLTDKYPPWVWA